MNYRLPNYAEHLLIKQSFIFKNNDFLNKTRLIFKDLVTPDTKFLIFHLNFRNAIQGARSLYGEEAYNWLLMSTEEVESKIKEFKIPSVEESGGLDTLIVALDEKDQYLKFFVENE